LGTAKKKKLATCYGRQKNVGHCLPNKKKTKTKARRAKPKAKDEYLGSRECNECRHIKLLLNGGSPKIPSTGHEPYRVTVSVGKGSSTKIERI